MAENRVPGSVRREQILEAALLTFAEVGYDAATTKAIAAKAGVNEAILFRFFEKKYVLFVETLRTFGPRHQFGEIAVGDAEAPLPDLLCAIVSAYLDTFWSHRAWMKILFLETGRDPELFREFRTQNRELGVRVEILLTQRPEVRHERISATIEILSAATAGFLLRSVRGEPKDWPIARTAFVQPLTAMIATYLCEERYECSP